MTVTAREMAEAIKERVPDLLEGYDEPVELQFRWTLNADDTSYKFEIWDLVSGSGPLREGFGVTVNDAVVDALGG